MPYDVIMRTPQLPLAIPIVEEREKEL